MIELTYSELRENGLCTQCRKPNPTPDMSRCPDCMRRTREQRRSNREYASKIGMCTVCFKGIPLPGKKICEDCLDKISDYDANRNTPQRLHTIYKKRKESCTRNGICIGCKKRPAREGHAYCVTCYAKQKTKREQNKSDIIRSERPNYGLCYICGNELDNKTNVCTACRNKIFKRKG